MVRSRSPGRMASFTMNSVLIPKFSLVSRKSGNRLTLTSIRRTTSLIRMLIYLKRPVVMGSLNFIVFGRTWRRQRGVKWRGPAPFLVSLPVRWLIIVIPLIMKIRVRRVTPVLRFSDCRTFANWWYCNCRRPTSGPPG